MRRAAGPWWNGAALLGFFSSTWLAHLAISGDGNGMWRWALLALPLLALGCWAFARSARKSWWLVTLLLAGAGIYLLEQRGNLGMAAAYGVPHAVANGLLLWWFARTLQDGREPLITRVARRIHGTLTPRIQRYTRQVTIAWCVFFAAQVGVSLVLFVFSSLETWSMFVNVLNLPLLVLMFAGEYLVRAIWHPDHPRVSAARMLRAFAKDESVSADAKAP